MDATMRLIEIRKHVDRVPFRPFRIHLSDGTSHTVHHPNLMLLTRDTVALGVLRPGDEFPTHANYYDPLHITWIEPIDTPAT